MRMSMITDVTEDGLRHRAELDPNSALVSGSATVPVMIVGALRLQRLDLEVLSEAETRVFASADENMPG
jgi:hypothetical protein